MKKELRLWMLRDYDSDHDSQYKNCRDLKNDPIVMWQHRHYMPLVLGLNFGIPVLLGLWHGDVLGMLLLAGVAQGVPFTDRHAIAIAAGFEHFAVGVQQHQRTRGDLRHCRCARGHSPAHCRVDP